MADEKELSDLRERIGRLPTRDQAWLLETVLADNRRRWDEEVARQQAAIAALREFEQQRGGVVAPAPVPFPPESEREAG
jgi:hypothetical protein